MNGALTWNTLVDILDKGGVVALMALIIYSGQKDWWAWSSGQKRELESLKDALLREQARAERAEAEQKRLHELVEGSIVGGMVASNLALSEARAAAERLATEARASASQIERLIAQVAELKGRRQ